MSRLMARGCTRATAGSDTGRSTSLPQHVLDRFRVLRDDGQQHTRRRVGVRPALFPVPQSSQWKAKLSRELRLAEPHLQPDRKSTRLNSSHLGISYAVFCLKKKK